MSGKTRRRIDRTRGAWLPRTSPRSNRRENPKAYSVYVIQLDSRVWGRRSFRTENPDYRPGEPLVYVGMTSRTPEERFRQHLDGVHASAIVRTHGLRLLPEVYEHLNPLTREEATRQEVLLAAELRRRGWGVWQN